MKTVKFIIILLILIPCFAPFGIFVALSINHKVDWMDFLSVLTMIQGFVLFGIIGNKFENWFNSKIKTDETKEH